jgi:hypothetical protein
VEQFPTTAVWLTMIFSVNSLEVANLFNNFDLTPLKRNEIIEGSVKLLIELVEKKILK